MVATNSLPLIHSWPLYEAAIRMPFGHLLSATDDVVLPHPRVSPLPIQGIGIWHCDLRNETLCWSAAVHDLFGLPIDEPLCRAHTVSLYLPDSRVAMQELRAHAIRHKRGFTLDVQIRRPDGDQRWVRLSALPIVEGCKVVRLCGTKQDVTMEYDGAG